MGVDDLEGFDQLLILLDYGVATNAIAENSQTTHRAANCYI